MKEYLECGKIANTHGVRGGLIIESWCDSPEVLAALKTVYTEKSGLYSQVNVIKSSVYKGRVLAEIEGVDSLEKAAALKNTVLFAKRDDLPLAEGNFFVQDLIGLTVYEIDTDKVYGKLSDVISGAASDIYEVENERGKFLIPVVSEFVKEIDLERGIFIKAIEGMFE
ncbi:MAG: 16S rRNA processing protein RimM [Ruminococcaceae bacterium]|nr:16S rRNA processing protein RimM [Oscillospiraceae bacterium]